MIEYQNRKDSTAWKVENFEWLSAEFNVPEPDMPAFHESISKFDRPWEIIRLLYGIHPILVPVDTDADYLRAWTKLEVAVKFGYDSKRLDDQLIFARSAWEGVRPLPPEEPGPEFIVSKKKKPAKPRETPAPKTIPVVPSKDGKTIRIMKRPTREDEMIQVKLDLPVLDSQEDEDMLHYYGFSDSTFDSIDRDLKEAVAERAWFITRIKDMQRLLDEPAVASIAKESLINEMYLRRMNAEISKTQPGTSRFSTLSATKKQISEEFSQQWDQIREVVPFASQAGSKIAFANVLSDVVDAWKKFKAFGDNALIDGLYTAAEIQIMCREAEQHDIRYRPGQVAAIREAVNGLWDPDFKRKISNSLALKLDKAFAAAFKVAREELGESLPDLESDDPVRGEYPPLFIPSDEPAESVPLE